MQTLSGNLAEGKPLPAKRTVPTPARTEAPSDADIRKPSRSQRLQSTVSPPTLAGALSAPPALQARPSLLGDDEGLSMDKKKTDHQRIVFNFKMDEIDMRLYEGKTGLEEGRGLIERTDRLLFGQMKVTQLKVNISFLLVLTKFVGNRLDDRKRCHRHGNFSSLIHNGRQTRGQNKSTAFDGQENGQPG